ncbi:hypothetical protein A2333_01745 [Candidatus Wolfebacteria bacterium RIFOXYB2_FULL_49_7]|uniref:Uncharacterized protein n=1 Tax=Candidatus Wolfebacteria bacterium RIFOXYB1_FULL_54_12 TaxID=1802559 RepID=A0A1F8DVI3_9BACT|nr:MAG: hypothetical protein A2372_04085 [Candidatus Wolfebacteria bacterium RIFOXYB1_FULL_54_12]OGM94984.1 MAG: hypothetical protein A2333_01745 [Candidatus Wolfebacteria bacterium RIFOXYB2_FULL_49_7]
MKGFQKFLSLFSDGPYRQKSIKMAEEVRKLNLLPGEKIEVERDPEEPGRLRCRTCTGKFRKLTEEGRVVFDTGECLCGERRVELCYVSRVRRI